MPSNEERQSSTAQDGHDSDERQPLLPKPKEQEQEPFPFFPFLVLMVLRVSEPISFSIIFPFINPLVAELKGEDSNVGLWAGLIESLFMATQCFTLLFWGGQSDKRGRKPILLCGLSGSALSIVLFGLSKSFWWAVVARCLSGALNGNVAVVKSALAELVPSRHHPIAFSSLSICWGIGVTIGPALGGFLAQPAQQYPTWFSRGAKFGLGGLWEKYPYFLPCSLAGSLASLSIIFGLFFLPETLPRIVKQRKRSHERSEDSEGSASPVSVKQKQPRFKSRVGRVSSFYSGFTPTASGAASPHSGANARQCSNGNVAAAATARLEEQQEPSSRTDSADGTDDTESSVRNDNPEGNSGSITSLIRTPHIQRLLVTQAFLSLVMVGLDAMQILYFYEPIDIGGLSLQPSQTGLILSLAGAVGTVAQIGMFPRLQRQLGTLRLYRFALMLLPFSVVTLPMANVVARGRHLEGGVAGSEAGVWGFVAASNLLKVFASFGFASNMLLVNQSASLFATVRLGTLNALAQMASSAMRAIGPLTFSTLLSITFQQQLLKGYLAWLVLAVISSGGILASMGIADVEGMIHRGEVAERIEGRDA